MMVGHCILSIVRRNYWGWGVGTETIDSRDDFFQEFNLNSFKYMINMIFILQADENLRLIKTSLPRAVEACIDAAGHEFDISRQRNLLRAASYGQAFCRFFFLYMTVFFIQSCILFIKNEMNWRERICNPSPAIWD